MDVLTYMRRKCSNECFRMHEDCGEALVANAFEDLISFQLTYQSVEWTWNIEFNILSSSIIGMCVVYYMKKRIELPLLKDQRWSIFIYTHTHTLTYVLIYCSSNQYMGFNMYAAS